MNEPDLAILQDPNHQLQPNTEFTPQRRNLEIPSFEADRAYGVELMREINRRHAFVATLNIWDGEMTGNDIAPQIPIASATRFENVPRASRYNVFITNLWLGWRYHIPVVEEKSRVFIDVGLIGLAYGQMTIDTLLKVTTDEPFPVASSLEAEGWGFTSRWGFGGAYFLKKWIAISFRTSYIVGKIPRLKVRRFFPSGFSTPAVPQGGSDLQPRPQEGEVIEYAEVQRVDATHENRTNIRSLPLELDGLEAMIGIHFYF